MPPIRQTKKSDAEPAAAAFAQFYGPIYRFLLRRIGDAHDADELAQRVFADAAEALRDPAAQPRSVGAFLYTVAERRFVDEIRRRTTARQGLARMGRPASPDYEYGREVGSALRAAIERLPEEQRIVVVKKVIQGKSFAEIASDLGVSVDACKMRLSRAVQKLRVDLAAEGLGPR